jgi:hypothetical protein
VSCCLFPQIDSAHLTIVNDSRVQDGHHEEWDQGYVSRIVQRQVKLHQINTVRCRCYQSFDNSVESVRNSGGLGWQQMHVNLSTQIRTLRCRCFLAFIDSAAKAIDSRLKRVWGRRDMHLDTALRKLHLHCLTCFWVLASQPPICGENGILRSIGVPVPLVDRCTQKT